MTDNVIKIEKLLNASQKPKVYYCRHMQIGLAGYEDETILIELEAMKKMMPSFVGCPLYVFHVDDVDLENLQATADGYISDCFYNEKDGWVWAKFVAVSDEAIMRINEGWSVSNAYIPREWGGGGTWHNVDYNRKISDGEFTHLAIVPNPRYEDARIFTPDEFKDYQETLTNELKALHNSKSETKAKNEDKKMFKLFKNTKQEVTSIDEETMIELQNGKEVSIADMVAALENAKKNEEEEQKVNMDTEIDVAGEKLPLKELVNRYTNMSKKNAEMDVEPDEEDLENADDEEEKANKSDEEEKANESEEAKKEEEKQQKKNDKHFNTLMNADKNPVVAKKFVNGETLGKQRYGKK